MNLQEIEKQATALMTAHGVGRLKFEFDRGKNRIAAMHSVTIGGYSMPERITFSRHFAELLSEEEIREVILHEIAHALAGHRAGHGPVWAKHARELGIKPERCRKVSVSPEASVKSYCPACGALVSKQHRLPLRVYWHRTCGRTNPLYWTKNGVRLTLEQMPAKYQQEYRRSFQ